MVCSENGFRLAQKMHVKARAFQWEYCDKGLKLVQLLGQLGVFLTCHQTSRFQRATRPMVAHMQQVTCEPARRMRSRAGPSHGRCCHSDALPPKVLYAISDCPYTKYNTGRLAMTVSLPMRWPAGLAGRAVYTFTGNLLLRYVLEY